MLWKRLITSAVWPKCGLKDPKRNWRDLRGWKKTMTITCSYKSECVFRFQKRNKGLGYSYTDPLSEKTENRMKEKEKERKNHWPDLFPTDGQQVEHGAWEFIQLCLCLRLDPVATQGQDVGGCQTLVTRDRASQEPWQGSKRRLCSVLALQHFWATV